MRDGQPNPVTRLADYQPPAWLVPDTTLDVDLRDGHTLVTAHLTLRDCNKYERGAMAASTAGSSTAVV